MKRLLDIEFCQQCKHVEYASNGRDQFMLCMKSDKIIKKDNQEIHSIPTIRFSEEIDIPLWCSLQETEDK